MTQRPVYHEPDKITGRPPFVPRKGTFVRSHAAQGLPPMYDSEVERFKDLATTRKWRKERRAVLQEEFKARSMVLELEAWERSHVGTSNTTSENVAYGTEGNGIRSTMLSYGGESRMGSKAPLWRSSSDTRLDFCRQRGSSSI